MSAALFRMNMHRLAATVLLGHKNVIQNEESLTQSLRHSGIPSDRRASMHAALISCQGIKMQRSSFS